MLDDADIILVMVFLVFGLLVLLVCKHSEPSKEEIGKIFFIRRELPFDIVASYFYCAPAPEKKFQKKTSFVKTTCDVLVRDVMS